MTCRDGSASGSRRHVALPESGGPEVALRPHAIGVHAVRIDRLRKMIDREDGQVVRRLFTASELDYAQRGDKMRWESLAGRLAAKVAARRLLAEHGQVTGWREIEVLRGDRGQPLLVLHGRARRVAEKARLQTMQVSISHEAGIAIAVVLTGYVERHPS